VAWSAARGTGCRNRDQFRVLLDGVKDCAVFLFGCRGTGGDVEYRSATNARVIQRRRCWKIDGDVFTRRGNTSRGSQRSCWRRRQSAEVYISKMANAERRGAILGGGTITALFDERDV